jgi:hypothetical protein
VSVGSVAVGSVGVGSVGVGSVGVGSVGVGSVVTTSVVADCESTDSDEESSEPHAARATDATTRTAAIPRVDERVNMRFPSGCLSNRRAHPCRRFAKISTDSSSHS